MKKGYFMTRPFFFSGGVEYGYITYLYIQTIRQVPRVGSILRHQAYLTGCFFPGRSTAGDDLHPHY